MLVHCLTLPIRKTFSLQHWFFLSTLILSEFQNNEWGHQQVPKVAFIANTFTINFCFFTLSKDKCKPVSVMCCLTCTYHVSHRPGGSWMVHTPLEACRSLCPPSLWSWTLTLYSQTAASTLKDQSLQSEEMKSRECASEEELTEERTQRHMLTFHLNSEIYILFCSLQRSSSISVVLQHYRESELFLLHAVHMFSFSKIEDYRLVKY